MIADGWFNVLIICVLMCLSCVQKNPYNIELKSGDLLFVAADVTEAGNLDGAIDAVTRTHKQTNFSHVGIVEKRADSLFVVHATAVLGVVRQPLVQFVAEQSEITVYRLADSLQSLIPNALLRVDSFLGAPYDHAYIMGKGSFYCSGLIYELFKSDSLFQLQPMTFKNPETGEFHSTWIQHYERLGVEIPEGLPGCNPNGMAAAECLHFMGVLSVSKQ